MLPQSLCIYIVLFILHYVKIHFKNQPLHHLGCYQCCPVLRKKKKPKPLSRAVLRIHNYGSQKNKRIAFDIKNKNFPKNEEI